MSLQPGVTFSHQVATSLAARMPGLEPGPQLDSILETSLQNKTVIVNFVAEIQPVHKAMFEGVVATMCQLKRLLLSETSLLLEIYGTNSSLWLWGANSWPTVSRPTFFFSYRMQELCPFSRLRASSLASGCHFYRWS